MGETQMKTVVLCFGNEFVKMDSLPLKLCKKLKDKIPGVEFVSCESPNEIMDYSDYDDVFILDTVKEIKDVSIIYNIDSLKERKIYTLHDFDLSLFLKLLNNVKEMKNIKIIGIPVNYDESEAEKRIKKLLTKT
jgi:Ni,Fe-hydrogenase maturation factor